MADPQTSLAILEGTDLSEDRLSTLDSQVYSVLEDIWTDRSDPANPIARGGGNLKRDKCVALHNLVSAIRPTSTIEIGLFMATSAIVIMAAAQRAGYLGHIAMDPVQSSAMNNAGIKNIEKAGLTPAFSFLEAESCYGLPYIIMNKKMSFDFAFIDASHHFDHTMIEFFYLDRLIPVGGIIGFDDVGVPAVKAAINYVAANRHYACRKTGAFICAVKMAEDSRHWFEFNRFDIPETDQFLSNIYKKTGRPPRLKKYD